MQPQTENNQTYKLSLNQSNDNFQKNNPDFTSKILIQAPCQQNQNYLCLYLPVYLRLDILRFEELAVVEQKAIVASKVYFDIDVSSLPQDLVKIIINNMRWHLMYQEGQTWDFNDEDSDDHQPAKPIGQFQVQGKTLLRYQMQNKFETRAITNIVWTPFEATCLILSIRIENIQISRKDVENATLIDKISKMNHSFCKDILKSQGLSIKFNSMEYRYDLQRVNNRGEIVGDMAQVMYNYDVSVGLYQLAERIIQIQNTDSNFSKHQIAVAKEVIQDLEQSCWVNLFQYRKPHPTKQPRPYNSEDQLESEQLKFKVNNSDSFNNIHFQITLGRRPLVSIFELMIPGYILGLISLVIFFQSPGQDGLADRVSSVATVILAYIALLPVIRSQIPAVPKLSIVQAIGYLEIMISVLALIESFVGSVNEEYSFQWYTNPFFLISLIIQAFATFIFVSAIATYYFKWLAMFSVKKGMRIPFKPHQWNNIECDRWFKQRLVNVQRRKIQQLI